MQSVEGSGLDLTDVVHTQIPREKEKGQASVSKYQSVQNFLMFFEGTWEGHIKLQMLRMHFSHGDQSSRVGSSVQRGVRGLDRVDGGQAGGEEDGEENFPQ